MAEGEEGTSIRFDVAVSPEALERLRFRSSHGEQPLKGVRDGRVQPVLSLQGMYRRLSADSAREFEVLLLNACS